MFEPAYLVNFPLSFILSCLIYRVFESCLTLRPQKWARISFYLLLFFLSSPIILPGETTATLGILIFLLPGVLLFFTNPFLIKTAVTLIVYPLWISFYYLTENGGYVIWLHVFQMDMSPLAENALHLLFSLLRIPFWLLILRFTRKWLNPTRTHLSAQIWLMISVLCLSSFLGAITLIAQVSLYYRTFTIWPACAACILTNLGICRLCAFVSNKVREAAAADMLQAQQSYYEDLRREQKRVRELRHDMANHLSVAQSLITQEKVLQAQNYLSELSQEISSASPKEFCRMETVNALLNVKYRLAAERQIDCRIFLELPQNPGIDEVGLCSLIANTLDNAIEACGKIPDVSRRRILLKGRLSGSNFSYYIENSVSGASKKTAALPSGRGNGRRRGLGLSIVRGLVSQAGGTLSISSDEEQFSVTVLLPVKNNAEN